MRNKLQNNASQIPTAEMRVAYARARLTGEAGERVLVRNEQRPFRDTEEVFEFLSKVYRNASRAIIAKNKLSKLYMKNADKFQDFLSEFSQLATEPDLSERHWTKDLWKRMAKRLKEKLIDDINDTTVTYNWLVDKAINAANLYKSIDLESQAITKQVRSAAVFAETGNCPRGITPLTSTTRPTASRTINPVKNSPVSTPTTSSPAPAGRGRILNNLREALRKNGFCFYC